MTVDDHTESPVIRCRGVRNQFGTEVIHDDLDLDVRRGEILMVVGPSGSGKTTLISIIASILNQDSGTCEVLGHDVRKMDERQRAFFRRGAIGFVFQTFNLLPALTAAENVAMPLIISGVRRSSALAEAHRTLDLVGLGSRSDALPAQLSGGQQQRVAIGRSLVHDPRLIVCDEPTSNLDHEAGHNMMKLLKDVAKGPDRAVIVVTHDERIFEFGDRIARMEDGEIREVIEVNGTGHVQ